MSSAELSQGWGVESGWSAIRPERSQFFLAGIVRLVSRKRTRLRRTGNRRDGARCDMQV